MLTGDAHTATIAREPCEAMHMPAIEDQVTPAEYNSHYHHNTNQGEDTHAECAKV